MDQYNDENRFYARRMQEYLQDEVISANEGYLKKKKKSGYDNFTLTKPKVKKIDGPGNTSLARQLDIENWTLVNKTPAMPRIVE